MLPLTAFARASSPGPAPETVRRQLHGLDLVRGLAAIMVLIYHVDFMFGLRGQLMPGGYLAVDLFFILSGFVIAYNYEHAIATRQLSFSRLAVRRFGRLYPLYALTMAIGWAVMTARFYSLNNYLDTERLTHAAVLNTFLLPVLNGPYGSLTLFPFNGASWSIFYEVVANILFATLFAGLPTRLLVLAWLLAGAGLGGAIWSYGSADLGWGSSTFLHAIPRVVFSFLTGMLIFRCYLRSPWTVRSALPFAALLLATGSLVQVKLWLPESIQPLADGFAILVLLPALVIAAVGVVLSGGASRVATILGETSYAVYLIQGSMIIAAAGVTQYVFKTKIADLSPFAGFVFVPVCIAASYVVYRVYEAPARQLFRSLAPGRRAAGAIAKRTTP
jgi:peptidoglycan/LPS O-acetylase OafA/YrhL